MAESEINVTTESTEEPIAEPTVAGDIPEKITVDLAGLDVGDVITISSVTLPKGSKTTIDRDFVIANISAPSGLRSSENEGGDEVTEEVATEE